LDSLQDGDETTRSVIAARLNRRFEAVAERRPSSDQIVLFEAKGMEAAVLKAGFQVAEGDLC